MLQRTLFSLLSLRPVPVAGFGHMFSLSSYTTYRLLRPSTRLSINRYIDFLRLTGSQPSAAAT